MTIRLIYENDPSIKQSLTLGPRLEGNIRRRIHELENRAKGALSNAEKGEMQRLRELLAMAKQGDGL
jgi:hypothetical protein